MPIRRWCGGIAACWSLAKGEFDYFSIHFMKIFFLTFFLLFVRFSAKPADLSSILTDYYQLKNALVAGDAAAAASAAGEMLKAINGVDMGSMTSADHAAFMAWQDKLAFDARHISESKDINHQREHFMSLSTNLFK